MQKLTPHDVYISITTATTASRYQGQQSGQTPSSRVRKKGAKEEHWNKCIPEGSSKIQNVWGTKIIGRWKETLSKNDGYGKRSA
ncbi:hypothetical protein PUN28_010346 [Cardiocondyla obscurior]|uniref:Uncharacterized protein n=1 Tax=Cardiocondyla obscurior TaxID=286306 RepID=A0AAW2FQ98_9HYME